MRGSQTVTPRHERLGADDDPPRPPGAAAGGGGAGGRRSVGGRARAAALAAILTLPAAGEAAAQSRAVSLTLEQVERKFRGMNVIHIRKCDRGGDDLYDRGEIACVAGIYNVMYRER